MDINLNAILQDVRKADGRQFYQVGADFHGKVVSQQKMLSPEEKENVQKFRLKLFEALSATGVDKDVLRELREKLGVPEGKSAKVSDTPLLVRDVKEAVEMVSAKVRDRITATLRDQKFDKGVLDCIDRAVRANPQHEVVKKFLTESIEGLGTVDNLAKLCRMTYLANKDSAKDKWSLLYLEGFSYRYRGENLGEVKSYNFDDKQRFEQGQKDYDSLLDKEKKLGRASGTTEAIIEEKEDNEEPEKKIAVNIGGKCVHLDKATFGNKSSEDFLKFIACKTSSFDFKAEFEKTLADVKAEIVKLGKEGLKVEDAVGESFKEDELFEAFVNCLARKWAAVDLNSYSNGYVFNEAKNETIENGYKACVMRAVVNKCQGDIEELRKHDYKSKMLDRLRQDFLQNVEKMKSLDGNIYQDILKVGYAVGMQTGEKPEGTPVLDAMCNALKTKIDALKGMSVEGLKKLKKPVAESVEVKDGEILSGEEACKQEKTMFLQGKGTKVCFVRSVQNSLVFHQRADLLPKKVVDKYVFSVKLEDEKARLTVSEAEIEALKKWYADKVKDKPSEDLKESDWAINLGMAKLAMYNDKVARKGSLLFDEVAAPNDFSYVDGSANGGYDEDDKSLYDEYLKRQLVTKEGFDDQVAELCGLQAEPNVAVNCNSVGLSEEIAKGGGLLVVLPELPKADRFVNWNTVRNWMEAHPDGVVTLNIGQSHTVAVTGCYFTDEGDFGFNVRDSLNSGNLSVNVNSGSDEGGDNVSSLNIHCYLVPAKKEEAA